LAGRKKDAALPPILHANEVAKMTVSIREALIQELARRRAHSPSHSPYADERAVARAAHEAVVKEHDAATPALAPLDVLAFASGDIRYQVTHIEGNRVAARPISTIGKFVGPVEIGTALSKTAVLFKGFNGRVRLANRAFTRGQVLEAAARRRERILQTRASATPLPG
jgi:hypothetical protein